MTAQEIAIDVIDSPQVSILPSGRETAQDAIQRQLAFVGAINHLISETFTEGVHFATIPGTNKPTLMLPGIELARGLLGVREEFNDLHVVRNISDPDNPFVYYEVECILIHIHTGLEIGRGQAVCHTREKSFMRQETRTCPNCGSEAIIKGKEEYGGGWLCWSKKGGCNAKFADNDESITGQEIGMVNDPQLVWDGMNRARKIANKRAKADAIKNAAMLSERFTVDMDDDQPIVTSASPAQSQTPPAPKQSKPAQPTNDNGKEKDFHTRLFTDERLKNGKYSGPPHIANALKKWDKDPEAEGLEATVKWLLDRKQESTTAPDVDNIPF